MSDGRFAPIILAAGRGRRLGGPKALVEIGGRTALARCLDTCRAAAAPLLAPIVVIGPAGARAAAGLADAIEAGEASGKPAAGGILLVRNPDPDRGQTSSVQAGLARLPEAAAGFLVFPVDHLLVTPADLEALVDAALAHPGAPVVLPSHGGRAGHPALVRRELAGEIMALGPDEPLRRVLRSHREQTVFVSRPDPGVVLDVDTPGDLEQAIALERRRRREVPR